MKSIAIAVLLAACGNDVGIEVPDASNTMTGEEIFRLTCARCHGPDGGGTVEAPQILDPVRGYATYVVRHGRGIEMGFPDGMPMFDTVALPSADLAKVLDFLSAAPHPTDGAGLYVRFCGNCHGADGDGGRVDEGVRGAESDAVFEETRRGAGGTAYGSRTEYMPAWSASELTDAEVGLIAQYLATL